MAQDMKTSSVLYNWLGPNCGIKVSNICLGTMTFGVPVETFKFPGNTDESKSHEILDRYYELGGNFIDTANVYTSGQSEEIIGSWLSKHERSSIVLATKVRFSPELVRVDESEPNQMGLSRGSIMTNIEHSLRRLKTDYIDLYYAHAWDSGVKLEETLRAFNDLVRSGKVRYIGLSNMTGAQIQKIVAYNQFMGFDQCVILQQEYNLLERNSEIEVIPTLKSEGVSLIPYSPLKGGMLTGKFKREDTQVVSTLAGTRLGWAAEKPAERAFSVSPNVEQYRENENYWKLMGATNDIAKAHGKTQTQVAIRWLLQKSFIPSVIIGAKTIQQLEDNMGAGAGWKLTDDQMKQLDDVSAFAGPGSIYPYNVVEGMNMNRIRKF
jgi:aryl-alcohol dehydrogenase-like predicted oxidoreductase